MKEPASQLYSPGETVRLDCQAEGIPTATITWSINGQPITGMSALHPTASGVQNDCTTCSLNAPPFLPSSSGPPDRGAEVDEEPRRSVSGGVLILRDMVFADTAVYQCEATNKHGSALLNTFIHVVGKRVPQSPHSTRKVRPFCCTPPFERAVSGLGLDSVLGSVEGTRAEVEKMVPPLLCLVDACGSCVRAAPSDSDL